MADLDKAIDYVLGWEDSTLSGVITTARDGKRTRFGIDEHFHPELANSLFYSSMGRVPALEIARAIYDTSYAGPLCIADIADQEIANKLLSLGVNIGIRPASKLLQDVLKVPGDGRIGPLTLSALEYADRDQVMTGLREEAEWYYKQVVADHPEDEPELRGWLRRAAA
jgi:lysozyme family protein